MNKKQNYIIFKPQKVFYHFGDKTPLLEIEQVKIKNLTQGWKVDLKLYVVGTSLKSGLKYKRKLKQE